MKHLRFELKKLGKNGALLLVVLMALLLGIANQVFSRSQLAEDRDYVTRLSHDAATVNSIFLSNMEFSQPGEEEFSTYAEKVIATYREQVFAANGGSYHFELPPSRELFARTLILVEDEGLALTAEEENNLRFALFQTDFLANRQSEEESLEHPTALFLLKRGFPFIYGIIPLVLFLAIAHHFQSEDREKGSDVYNACLPKSGRTSILARFVALLLLALLYVVLVASVSLLASVLSGLPLGEWDYPNRVWGKAGFHMTNFALLANVMLDIFLRLTVVVSLGLSLSVLISSAGSANIFACLMLLFGKFLTAQLPLFQSQFNPLYFSYQSRFLGSRSLAVKTDLTIQGFEAVAPRAYYGLSLPLLGLGLLPLLVALGVSSGSKNLSVQEKDTQLGSFGRFLSRSRLYKVYFEWRKLDELATFRQGLLTFFFLGLFLSGVLITRDLFTLEDNFWEPRVDYLKEDIERTQDELAAIEAEKKAGVSKAEFDELYWDKKDKEFYLEASEEDLQRLRQRIRAYREGDSETYYAQDVEDIKASHGKLQDVTYVGDSPYVNGDYPSNFSYKVNLARNHLLRERKIPPLLCSQQISTFYDEMKDPLQQKQQELRFQVADHSVLGLTYRFYHYYRLDIILLVLLVFICGVGYAIEQQRSASLCWLYTLPQRRTQLVLQKYLASLVRAIQYLFAFSLPLFIGGLLSAGWGRGDFPILRYLKPVQDAQYGSEFVGSYEFANLDNQVGRMLAMILLAAAFVLAFSLFISSFSTQVMSSLAFTFLLLAGGYAANTALLAELGNKSLAHYLPFVYLDQDRIVSGELLAATGNLNLNTQTALPVLFTWTLIFLAMTSLHIMLKRNVVKKSKL